jgi:hypothetical protein
MRDNLEMEADSAWRIAEAMVAYFTELESFWPKSKRGSNAQRCLDRLKEQRDAIAACLLDGLNSRAERFDDGTEEKR